MLEGNDSQLENNSFTFFSPIGLVLHDDDNMFEESVTIKILLTIYLGVAMVLSLIGNICTCAVIARNRSMRTPTNCYLFNLAVTDILTACFVPLEIYIIWIPEFYPLGEIGCRIHFMLWDFISNCSLLIITAFTVERYLVVTRPFLRQRLSLNSRVFKIVGVIWLISCFFSIPDIYFLDLLERKKYVFCYFTVSFAVSIIITIEIFVFFVIPMTIIIVLYGLIIIDLKSARQKLRSSPVTNQQNKQKIVKMLAAVAATFFFFWSPYCILRAAMVLPRSANSENYNANLELLALKNSFWNTLFTAWRLIFYLRMVATPLKCRKSVTWLNSQNALPTCYNNCHPKSWKILNYLCYNSYLSTVANPILYSLMSRKFRQAFKDLLKRSKAVPRKRIETTTTSVTISRHGSGNFNSDNFPGIKLHNT